MDPRRGEGRGQGRLILGSDLSLGVPAVARPTADGVTAMLRIQDMAGTGLSRDPGLQHRSGLCRWLLTVRKLEGPESK